MDNYTILYLIRHSLQLKELENIITDESSQLKNEKIILSCEGEKKAEKLSKNEELKNISEIWSSSYVRAISTAKYIAQENNILLNIDQRLNERKLR